MNINKHTKTRSGFTLIELLTVIAIIGILAGILIPTIGVVRKNASKATAASNVRQIVLGYKAFSEAGSRIRSIQNAAWAAGSTSASNMQGWIQVVAEFGDLNDAALYFVDSAPDAALLANIPTTILDKSGAAVAATAEWTAAVGSSSYEAAVEISPNARGVITPLVWTKDIDTAAGVTWPAASPWEGEGGHIGYLDGHVVFYTNLTGQLTDPATGAPANFIDVAIGGATALNL